MNSCAKKVFRKLVFALLIYLFVHFGTNVCKGSPNRSHTVHFTRMNPKCLIELKQLIFLLTAYVYCSVYNKLCISFFMNTPVSDTVFFYGQSQKSSKKYQQTSPKCKVSDKLDWNCRVIENWYPIVVYDVLWNWNVTIQTTISLSDSFDIQTLWSWLKSRFLRN